MRVLNLKETKRLFKKREKTNLMETTDVSDTTRQFLYLFSPQTDVIIYC